MRTAYLLHDSWSHYPKADWVAAHFPIDSFVIIKKTRLWWGKYLWLRGRRIGFARVLDELLFRAYWLLVHGLSDRAMTTTLMKRVKDDLPRNYTRPPSYHVRDINSSEAEALLKALAPDVCVLTIQVILEERIFSIPRIGMFAFHPGITPEYRGPHSAFWATLNNEFWGIGWSLLKIEKGIDTGAVLGQGSAQNIDPLSQSHIVMQHQSHVEGLPHVVEVLRKLKQGERPVVSTKGRTSRNYSHPRLTDYIKLRNVLKRLRADRGHEPDLHFQA
jgi:folate-dependent phosphoribosylglycinamide formyltransferase PurN